MWFSSKKQYLVILCSKLQNQELRALTPVATFMYAAAVYCFLKAAFNVSFYFETNFLSKDTGTDLTFNPYYRLRQSTASQYTKFRRKLTFILCFLKCDSLWMQLKFLKLFISLFLSVKKVWQHQIK